MRRTYWMSFVDRDLPRERQFLGVVVMEAESFEDAMQRSHQLGCNHGGEVEITELGQMEELHEEGQEMMASLPFGVLMDQTELTRRGLTRG